MTCQAYSISTIIGQSISTDLTDLICRAGLALRWTCRAPWTSRSWLLHLSNGRRQPQFCNSATFHALNQQQIYKGRFKIRLILKEQSCSQILNISIVLIKVINKGLRKSRVLYEHRHNFLCKLMKSYLLFLLEY